MRMPERISETHKYCVGTSDATHSMIKRFLDAQPGQGYDCNGTAGASGSGSALCTKFTQTYTGMNFVAKVTWKATMSRSQSSFQTNVAGELKYGGADPRVPSGQTPFTETITGAYQGSCIPTPQPSATR